MRPQVMKSDSDLSPEEIWMKEVPYDTRQQAITEAISSYKSNLTKYKRKQITHFNVKFKSKKDNSQVFFVNKKALNIKNMALFTTRLKKGKRSKLRLRKRDKVKYFQDDTLSSNFTILLTRPNHWYICLPRKHKEQPIFENPFYQSVFLDPGVRSFQTFYSPDGLCGKFGNKESIKVKELAMKHDELWSKSDDKTISSKTKRALRNRCAKVRHTRKCIVDNLQNQVASVLTNSFQNIFIPEFDTTKMTKRQNALSHKISRSILDLCHGAFKEKLKYQAIKKQRNVYIVNERYTTKTCGCCGHLQVMNGKKEFHCESCDCKIDRDYNGARNICLRSMVHGL